MSNLRAVADATLPQVVYSAFQTLWVETNVGKGEIAYNNQFIL
jgi:hypothetical protein